jgi:hypothetical protein
MATPKLKSGDLIALRDGEATRAGVEIALGRNTQAQRELLEARLLALAFTMPGRSTVIVSVSALRSVSFDSLAATGADTAPDTVDSPPDPETLEAYVTGALTGERLAAFEGSVRSDPNAFAALVAFKDAYFGLGRKRAPTWSPPPSARQELGTLTVQSYGRRMELHWDGDERGFPRFDRPLLAASMRVHELRLRRDDSDRNRFKRRDMQRRQLEELLENFEQALSLNESLERELRALRTDMLMAVKTGSPELLARLRAAVRELADRAEYTQSMLRKMERQIDETAQTLELKSESEPMMSVAAQFDSSPGADEIEIPTAAADLWFSADPRREGGLALRIQPTSREAAEFTWIRPGVDFELLAPVPGRALPLGVIDGEAMLLISRPGAQSQVIRVRAEGMRPA